VKRLALGLLVLFIALLCSACLASTGNGDDNPPTVETHAPSTQPTVQTPPPSSQPTVQTPPPSSQPTDSGVPKPETLAFGKSYTWDDGVRVTVGKPIEFQPSAYPVDEKSKRYLKFTVTVVNKSDKPLDLGLTYISVESNHEQAQDVFDSASGLRGPPTTKVLKGRESQFEIGFGVADPKDVVMEIAFHADPSRPSLLYST
jgi:hypothetical protein